MKNEEAETLGNTRGKVLTTITGNAVANLFRIGASWLSVLILPSILVRFLDKQTYATWILILQVGVYISLFDNGIQSVIGRFVGRANELNDQELMRRTLSSAACILSVAALIASIAVLILAWQFNVFFKGAPNSVLPDARIGLVIIGISMSIILPASTFAGAFLGLQKNKINAIAAIAGKFVTTAGIASAAFRGEGIIIMALWIAIGNILQCLIFFIAASRYKIYRLIHRTCVSGKSIHEFIRFCYAMFATQLGAILISGLDIPIVAAYDFHSAGYYAIAATVGNMLGVPLGAIIGPLIPVAAGMSAMRTPKKMGDSLIRVARYANAILCLLTFPLLQGLYLFLQVWVGYSYASHVFVLAIILVLAQFIRLLLLPYAAMGFSVGQQHRMLISPLGEGIVNITCSIVGAIWLGAIGVAIGTLVGAIAGVVLHFIISMPRTNAVFFLRRQLLIQGIFRPVACCIIPFILITGIDYFFSSRTIQLICLFLSELLAFYLIWIWNFSNEERIELKRVARVKAGVRSQMVNI